MSINPRMHRLFGADRKCFDVAIDHGFFNELNFLDGIENMKNAVEAGRLAYEAGRIDKKLYATASSPLEGVVRHSS